MLQPLLAPPRESLTEAEVEATLNLERGPVIRHGVDVLDTSDRPTGETVPVDATNGGEIVWSYRPPDDVVDGRSDNSTDAAEVRLQASLTLTGELTIPLPARRFRPWTEMLSPSGLWVRFNHGVHVPTSPPINDDGITIRRILALADKTFRYKSRKLIEPIEVAAATNCVAWVIDDLGTRFGETTTYITASTITLDVGKVFEPGLTMLDVYNALLETAGYDQLTCDENGRPTSFPLADLAARGPEVTYGPGMAKIVTAGAVEPLLPDMPNVARFVARQGPTLAEEGNGFARRVNTSTGPASVAARGGELIETVVEVDAEDQTALEAIADADSQRYFAGGGLRFTGQIGLNPRHGNRDVIGLDKPRLGLSGTWLVTEWRLPLKAVDGEGAVLMSITCEKRVVA